MEETSIEIRNLKKFYAFSERKGFSVLDLPGILKNKSIPPPMIKVLDGIDLDIRKGECFGIIGPNGTGKSTLLRLIAGIIPPDSGTVRYNGSLIPLLNLNVGFSSELNARDNVYQYGMILGFSEKEMDLLYDDIIAFSGLEKFQDMTLKNFSSGMRIKLAFSTAIQINPDILVLDEVLAVGDAAFKEKSQKKIREFCNSDKTVVIVSHSMGTIADLCDRALYLRDGKIFSIGEPQDVIDAYLNVMQPGVPPVETGLAANGFTEKTDRKTGYSDQIVREIAEMNVLPLIRSHYDADAERSLNDYLTWENLKGASDPEVLLRSGCEDSAKESRAGSYVLSFLLALGDETASRAAAYEIIHKSGFECFGNNTLVAFFNHRFHASRSPNRFVTLLVDNGTRMIPVVTDMRAISKRAAFQVLEKTNCTRKNATILFPPELFSIEGIAMLLDNSFRFLAPVPVQQLEEREFSSAFFEGIAMPANMKIFYEKPVFMKTGPVVSNGRQIEGFGSFDPRRVPPDYKTFFNRLDMLKTAFDSADSSTILSPEAFIQEIAKRDAKYFSGTFNNGRMEISINPVPVSRRQNLLGTVFCFHSGLRNAEEWYRMYEQWQLADRTFRFFYTIHTSDNACIRGRALVSLINTTAQLGVLKKGSS